MHLATNPNLSNRNYQIQYTKPNLLSQICSLTTKPNLPNQINWTKPTKSKQPNWIYKIISTKYNVWNAKNQIYKTKSIQSNLQNLINPTNKIKVSVTVIIRLDLGWLSWSGQLFWAWQNVFLFSKNISKIELLKHKIQLFSYSEL